jgi:glycosyltransferase involved in cell wall biosynthesis
MTTPKIGVATVPIYKSGNPPLSHLLDILYIYSKDLHLLTGNDGFIFFKHDPRLKVEGWICQKNPTDSFVYRLKQEIRTQIFITNRIILQRKNIDLWIFFFGGYRLPLPFIVAKLLRKKVILLLPDIGETYPGGLQDVVLSLPRFLAYFPYKLADKIGVYSPCLISQWGLEQYRNKIFIAHEHFLDFNKFKTKTGFNDRQLSIGFIGRLSTEKGIQNFVAALSSVREMFPGIPILIGGDGPLIDEIKAYLQTEKLCDHVEFTGWIPHDDLPDYLNRLCLLVIPSYREGLPNIALEAMACGTPVLSTPVGALPDILKEGETGFIMETNSPACIAENIIRVLKSPDIERIAENGRMFVQENYSFEKTVEIWSSILEESEKNIF